jgi:hypothetical protein
MAKQLLWLNESELGNQVGRAAQQAALPSEMETGSSTLKGYLREGGGEEPPRRRAQAYLDSAVCANDSDYKYGAHRLVPGGTAFDHPGCKRSAQFRDTLKTVAQACGTPGEYRNQSRSFGT